MRERKTSLGREGVCERHTREQWRNIRSWETDFVFVCEKDIFKRKSRMFSSLRRERHLCMRGVRVAHMGMVERNKTPGDKVLCLCERDSTWRIIVRDT